MNLLLDTHVAIWLVSEPQRFPPRIAALLQDETNSIFLSVISVWETSIKFALKKWSSPPFNGRELVRLAMLSGCKLIEVTEAHAGKVDDLPQLHGDPFDRLLVAQALSEGFKLITADAFVAAYSDSIITW